MAYFAEGKPVKGKEGLKYRWRGADWHFSSTENRARFEQNPSKYAPQYGGYCAYAMSDGKYAPIDPDEWTIRDGKLYLNYSNRIQKKWLKDVGRYIERADAQWAKLQASNP